MGKNSNKKHSRLRIVKETKTLDTSIQTRVTEGLIRELRNVETKNMNMNQIIPPILGGLTVVAVARESPGREKRKKKKQIKTHTSLNSDYLEETL